MITERKIAFPKYLPPDAVDLIDKLMQLNPYQRLGAGIPGSQNDYACLKQHPFFKTINFEKLQKTSPPIPLERFKSAFATSQDKEIEDSSKYFESEENEGAVQSQISGQECSYKARNDIDEMVIKSGVVYKRKGVLGNLKRKLILTNQPRLYFVTDQGQYKADIVITPFLKATSHSSDKFEITCKKSGKNIIFKVVGEDASIWANKINRVVEGHAR